MEEVCPHPGWHPGAKIGATIDDVHVTELRLLLASQIGKNPAAQQPNDLLCPHDLYKRNVRTGKNRVPPDRWIELIRRQSGLFGKLALDAREYVLPVINDIIRIERTGGKIDLPCIACNQRAIFPTTNAPSAATNAATPKHPFTRPPIAPQSRPARRLA